MNTQEALKMAIEALEDVHWSERTVKMENAIAPCKEALEDISKMETTSQPAQEPVAWLNINDGFEDDIVTNNIREQFGFHGHTVPLYTHPAPSWQGLSDDEIIDMYFQASISPQPHQSIINFIRAIEQALKEKNT